MYCSLFLGRFYFIVSICFLLLTIYAFLYISFINRFEFNINKPTKIAKEPGLSPIFGDEAEEDEKNDATKHTEISQDYKEGGFEFSEKLPHHTENDCILYAPEELGYSYNSGSNSADMDLASD